MDEHRWSLTAIHYLPNVVEWRRSACWIEQALAVEQTGLTDPKPAQWRRREPSGARMQFRVTVGAAFHDPAAGGLSEAPTQRSWAAVCARTPDRPLQTGESLTRVNLSVLPDFLQVYVPVLGQAP